jgi:MFS family permease
MAKKLSPRALLFILTGLNLFNYLDRTILATVLTPLQAELKLNDTQAGWANTAFMLGYFLTSPIFGYLGDRFPRKWLIAVGIFIWSLGTMLTGFANGFAWLLTYRVLVGLGEASYATISPGLISDTFEPARRNNALTIFYVAIPVGSALGYYIGSQIAAHYSWRDAFIWAGAPGLALALILLPFREPARGEAEGRTAESGAKPTWLEILGLFRRPQYALVVLGYVAYTFALGAFAVWGPNFLQRVHQMEVDAAGMFFGMVLVVAGLFGTMIGGFAATHWQKRQPAGYALTLGLSVLGAVPLTCGAFLAPDRTLSQICLAGAIFLLFLPTGPINTLILEAVPMNMRSSAMALSIFMIHLFGDMWSPLIVGSLSDVWGLGKAVLILPVALVVCAALWLWLAARTLRQAKAA